MLIEYVFHPTRLMNAHGGIMELIDNHQIMVQITMVFQTGIHAKVD